MSKIKIKQYNVPIRALPLEFAGYRIMQITDIHLGKGFHVESIFELAAKVKVDMVALTGDIIHRKYALHQVRPFLTKLLDSLKPTDGFFGVLGNHDKWITDNELKDLPIRWLYNEAVQLKRAGETINLIGLDQQSWVATDILSAMQNIISDKPVIVLAHYPSTAYLLSGVIDLVIAGHTHSGQIKIPGFPFRTNDDISWRHGGGVSKIGGTKLVVSAGLGFSGPFPFRIFTPSEITVIELTSAS